MPQSSRALIEAAYQTDPDGFIDTVREVLGLTPIADDGRWMTSKETADRLRMSDGTLRDLRHQGQGPRWARRGGTVLYLEAEVAAYERDIELRGEAERRDALSYRRDRRNRRDSRRMPYQAAS